MYSQVLQEIARRNHYNKVSPSARVSLPPRHPSIHPSMPACLHRCSRERCASPRSGSQPSETSKPSETDQTPVMRQCVCVKMSSSSSSACVCDCHLLQAARGLHAALRPAPAARLLPGHPVPQGEAALLQPRTQRRQHTHTPYPDLTVTLTLTSTSTGPASAGHQDRWAAAPGQGIGPGPGPGQGLLLLLLGEGGRGRVALPPR